jgi:ABC-type spermidine/putrescine transport system permease subunit II
MASVDAMAWRGVRLSNFTFAAPTPHLIAPPICVAVSIHLTIAAHRGPSRGIAVGRIAHVYFCRSALGEKRPERDQSSD